MRGSFVSQQVRILLERMDTHPEEFIVATKLDHIHVSKWEPILSCGGFTKLEWFLLKRKYKKIKRLATQEAIVLTILGERQDASPTLTVHSTVGRFNATNNRF